MTRPLITTDPTHEGAEQPMSDKNAGLCGNTIAGISGDPLTCDLLAGHDGWHGCDQIFTAAPMATATLTSTVSRCHWTNTAPIKGDPIAAAEQRGYDRAIANLLDRAKFSDYQQLQMSPDAFITEGQRVAAVAYLEAQRDQP